MIQFRTFSQRSSRDFIKDFCLTKERQIALILDRKKSQFWMIQIKVIFFDPYSVPFLERLIRQNNGGIRYEKGRKIVLNLKL